MKVSMSKLSPSERRRIQWWWWGRRGEQEIVLSSAPGLRGPRIRSWPLSAGSWECQWPPDTQVGHISSPYHIVTCIIYRLPRLPPPLTASWRHVGRGVCRGGVHVSTVQSISCHSMNKMVSSSLKISKCVLISCPVVALQVKVSIWARYYSFNYIRL